MLLMVKHPEAWLSQVQAYQSRIMAQLPESRANRLSMKRDALQPDTLTDFALVRVVTGVVGLKLRDNRIFALETGDCWVGDIGQLVEWYQEGAVELDVWTWDEWSAHEVASLLTGFQDLLLDLMTYNTKVPPDPMPGFEFFKSGDVIIKEGEEADSVITLIQGRAKVMVGNQQVGVVKENEIIGLQAMLLKTERTASVIADGPCSAVRVAYDKFRSLIESRPELVISTMETMARHIDRANQQLTQG